MENKKGIIVIIALSAILIGLLGYGIVKDKNDTAKNAQDYENWKNNSSSSVVKEETKDKNQNSSSSDDKNNRDDKKEEKKEPRKNFYLKLKDKEDVNVAIIGDKLALSEGRTSEAGIWSGGVSYIIGQNFGSKADVNLLAKSDLLTKDASDFISKQDFSQIDLTIVCLGHNDNAQGVDASTFKDEYTAFLEKIKEKNPSMEILALIPSTLANDNMHRQMIIGVSDIVEINTIDTRKYFEVNGVVDSGLMNGDLPNDIGYQCYTVAIGDVLKTLSNK